MLKNILKVFSGGVLAQVLNFLSFPIITSWYSPAAFGDYAIFAFFVAFLPMLMTLRMEMAVMQDPDDSEKNSLVFLSLVNGVMILGICLILGIFFSGKIGLEITVIAFGAFLASVQNMAISIANLKERYWVISISRSLFPVFFILMAWITRDRLLSFPLAISHVFATLLVVLFLIKATAFRVYFSNPNQAIKVLKKNIKYVMFDLPSNLLNASALLLPAYLIALFFDDESSGLYFLAYKLILSPLGAITMAVGYVYRREAIKEYTENKMFERSTQKIFLLLVILSSLMLVTYYLIGPMIFKLFFKDEWLAALPIISVLMPMFALKLVASPLSFSFYVVGKLSLDLYGQLFFLISSALAIYCGYLLNDFIKAVWFVAMASGIFYLVYAIKSIQFSKGKIA